MIRWELPSLLSFEAVSSGYIHIFIHASFTAILKFDTSLYKTVLKMPSPYHLLPREKILGLHCIGLCLVGFVKNKNKICFQNPMGMVTAD